MLDSSDRVNSNLRLGQALRILYGTVLFLEFDSTEASLQRERFGRVKAMLMAFSTSSGVAWI